MKERPAKLYPEEDPLMTSGAATEMTGLIPSGRPDKEERRSYQDVFPWLPPFAEPSAQI